MKPQWVDLQVNGYVGVDFNAPGLPPDECRAIGRDNPLALIGEN